MERKKIKLHFEEFREFFLKYFEKLDQTQKGVLLNTRKKVDHTPWDYSFRVRVNRARDKCQH